MLWLKWIPVMSVRLVWTLTPSWHPAGPLVVENSAAWLAEAVEEEGLSSVSSARPPAVCPGFGGEARGRFLWAVASVKNRGRRAGQHDEQHQVQKPDPGQNRWACLLDLFLTCSYLLRINAMIASCLCLPGRRSASLHLRLLLIHPVMANRG